MLKFFNDIRLAIDLVNALGFKTVTVCEMAKVLDTTSYNLQKIVRKLSAAKIIKASKGKGGGISRAEGDITLKMVLNAFYKNPIEEIKDSPKPSDRLNVLFINLLDMISIYEEGAVLSKLKAAEIQVPEEFDNNPVQLTQPTKRIELPPIKIENDIDEVINWDNGW